MVGDGNFSFSLNLLRTITKINLITSTLNPRSDDPVIVQNVESLEQMDVVVLHEVDGTQLSQCTYLSEHGSRFDVIVFNFPHTGGKGNVRRNRELLSGFFKSAAQFLNNNGEIQVTLCKGQGGTPMDCTTRGYDNSWKIVEMATFANLILSKVEPFPCELYPYYAPTGYRGLSKGFSLEGAMKHVFRFPQVDQLHWHPSIQGYLVCENCGECAYNEITVPFELQDAIHYPILSHSWHPVVQIKNMLVDHINNSTLKYGSWMGCVDSSYLKIHQIPSQCIPNHTATCSKLEIVTLHCPSCTETSIDKYCTGAFANNIHKGHAFLPSLELDIPRFISMMCHCEETPFQLICSPVVQNVDISLSRSAQPVSHELMGVIPLEVEEPSQGLEIQLTNLLDEILKKSPRLSQETTVPCTHICGCIPGVYVDEWKILAAGSCGSIAKFGVHSTGTGRYLVFIFLLESLAMVYYGINDIRLMRSKDIHFSTQFIGNSVVKYIPFCLSSPQYKHDISFWHTLPDSCPSAVRQKLSSIVRQTTGDIVADLACVDVYHNPDGHTSYCFRITYNHYDQPLSKVKANTLQLMIRDVLRRDSEIILR